MSGAILPQRLAERCKTLAATQEPEEPKSLAAQHNVTVHAILRLIYKQVIPQEHVHRAADSGVYLIDDYPGLMELLERELHA